MTSIRRYVSHAARTIDHEPGRERSKGGGRWPALLLACLAALGAGCGEAGESWPSPGAPIEALADAFAPCADPTDDIAEAVGSIAETVGWIEVGGVVEHPSGAEGEQATLPATVTVLSATGMAHGLVEPDDDTAVVDVHDSYWAGVDWALENDAGVWFGLADPAYTEGDTVAVVVVVLPDGRVFFPGDCSHDTLYAPMAMAYGGGLDAVVRDALGEDGDALADALHYDADPEEERSDIVVLNPETVSPQVLEELRSALLAVRISEPLGEGYTVCPKVVAGWNDCFMADERAAGDGYTTLAYHDGGPIEIWLLDGSANLTRPLALLGVVEIPEALASEEGVALHLAIDTHGVTALDVGDTRGGRVQLLEALPIVVFEREEPGWPGMGPAGTVGGAD